MDFAGMKRRELQALCKRHGLPAGGTNADLVARLDAALSGGARAEEEEVVGVAARKGCLKRAVGDAGEAKKVTFAVEESRGRRLRSRVVWSPVVAKTRGKRAEAGAGSAADDSISAEAGANFPVRRSRRNSLTAAEAKEIEAAVTVDRKRNRKGQEIAEDSAANAQVVATHRVTRRSSLSGNTVLLPPAAEKKRGRGRAADGKNKLAAEEPVAEAQDSSAAATVVESKRSRRKGENCEPDVQKSAKVEVSSGTTRSRSVEAVVMSPTVVEKKRRKTGDGQPDVELPTVSEVLKKDAPVTRSLRTRVVEVNDGVVDNTRTSQQLENKTQPSRPTTHRHKQVESSVEEEDQEQVAAPSKRRRKTGDGQPDVELPTVSEVLKKDAPVTRSLRNRVVQVNGSMFEETHTSQQLENKTQPSRPATRRHKQVESSVEEEDQEQVAAPSKASQSRRSGRNSSEASNANSENNKLGSALVDAKDLPVAYPLTRHNAKAQDVEKRPTVKEPVRRSTRKSVVSTMLDSEDKDLTEEKNPEAHVRRSMRRSIVPVKDIKGAGEEIQHAKGEDAVKQPTVKEPVRRSTRKSLAPAMHEKEEKNLIAEKNPVAHVRRSSRKSVVPVKDVGEDIQNTKGGDVENQLVVKQPVRRSSRKSVLPDTLENESGFIVAETNAEAHARRSTRKSVLPNMINMENPDLSKMARNGNFGIGECEDEKQQIVNEPVRRSRRSVATLTIEEQNKGLHEGKIPTRRSTRKSVALNVVEKGSMNNTENVGREVSGAGTRKLKVRDQHTDPGVAVVISGNDSQVEEAVLQRSTGKSQNPIEKGNTGANHDRLLRTHQASHSTTSMERSSKRRRTTAPEEVTSAEEANGDMVIREATEDACKVSHEYIKESSSRIQETCQVKATGEEFPSSQIAKESLDKSKQPEEHTDIQDDDIHLSETRNEELDQSLSIAEPHNGFILEDKTLMGEADFTVGDGEAQSPVSNRVPDSMGTRDRAVERRTEVENPPKRDDEPDRPRTPHRDGESESGFEGTVPESGDYPVAGQGTVSWEANTTEFGEKNLACIMSTGLHTKTLPHDIDVLSKDNVEASGSTLPTSDDNPEIHCDVIAEESIQAADLGRCPSMDGKGNLPLTNLHSKGAADNSILPVLNAAKRCSSDERHSSFGLEFMLTEACKESCCTNVKNTAVEVDGGNKSSTCLTPGFHVGLDCGLEDEDVQPTGFDADKKVDVDQDVTEEEVVAERKSCDGHAAAKTDLKTKLYCEFTGLDMVTDCSIAEKNLRLVADNTDDEEATIQVQQDDVQEGDPEKPSQFSATPECKHECSLPEETTLHSKNNKGCSSSAEQSPFGLQSLFSQESIEKSVEYDALAATVHMEDGFDELKECHVKLALEKVHVSKPHHDTDEADISYGVSNAVLSRTLHAPANDNYDACLRCNIELLHQGHKDQCSEDTEEQFASKTWSNDIFEGATPKYIEGEAVLLPAEERSHSQDGQLNSKFEGTEVVESGRNFSKDLSSILDNGSDVGIVGERTLYGSDLPKDSSVEYNLQPEHLDGPSVETFLDGSTNDEKNVSRDTSFGLATPSYKHEGALSEKAVRTMKKYAGTHSSNPRELITDLQSLFSKENNEKSLPHDGSACFPGSESVDVEQQVEVHLGSNLSQLESTDLLDGLVGCSKTDVLLQGHKDPCKEDRVEQVASGSCTDDIVEAAAAIKYIKSGSVMLPSEERSNLKDVQPNSKQESTIVIESGLNCNNDVASVVDIIGQRTPSGSGLPEDCCTDHDPQQELIDGCSVESSLQGSTIFGKKNVDGVAGTIENPSFSLATPDYKHEGALSEEAACKPENCAGTCSTDPKHLLMELQSLFSEGSIEKSDLHDDLAFPSTESRRNEPTVCHYEKPVDTLVSSEPDTYQGPRLDLGRAEEKESCVSTSVQHNESRGSLRSSHMKDWVTSAHISMSDDAYLTERNIVVDKVLCDEKEKRKCFVDVLQSHSNEYGVLRQHHKDDYYEHNADQVPSGIYAMSEAAPIKVLESDIALVQAVETSALPDEQLNPELKGDEVEKHSLNCEKDNNQILGMRSSMSKRHLLSKDSHTIYCQEQELPSDLSPFESAKEFAISLDESFVRSGICQSDCQKRIAEIGSKLSSCDAEVLRKDHKEESNKHSEDKIIPKVHENDLSEAAPFEGMESAIMRPSVSRTLEMPDEQLKTKLNDEGEEYSFSCDKDIFEIKGCHIDSCQKQEVSDVLSVPKSPEESANCLDESVSGSGPCQTSGQQWINESSSMQMTSNIEAFDHEENYGNNEGEITPGILASSSNMSEDAGIERSEGEIGLPPSAVISALPDEQLKPPGDLSAPRSPEESTVLQNYCVPGIYQSSRRRGIDELRAKLQSFKVSSTVKGSYIAMSAPRPKQCDNLGQSATPLLQNREITHAVKADDPGILASSSNMSEDAGIERSEGEIGLPTSAVISALPDEQLTPPSDLSAPRSPEESTVLQNYCIPGSVGICQSSRRRGIDEIRTKLQSFKVSSTVKGSYIAMSGPRPKQCDNLGQSAIPLLQNRGITHAVKADDLAKLNPDPSVAKDLTNEHSSPLAEDQEITD